jgi:hypothetical protein
MMKNPATLALPLFSLLLVASVFGSQVEMVQIATNDAPTGGVIDAVLSADWLETAQTVTTVTAPELWSGYRFTHWTVSSNPADEFRDPWGRAENPVSFTLYEHTTATAHYLPATQGSIDDGVPDWHKMHYYGALAVAASSDTDGDGFTLLQEFQNGTHPLYGNSTQAGGISRTMSEPVVVNLAGYAAYTLRSDPVGAVDETATVPPGTTIITPHMTQTTFGYWTLDGVPQRDPWGVAWRQISFTMAGVNREAVAYMFSSDSDTDGLPDAWETYHLGTLTNGAGDDLSGDGRSLLVNYQSGQNPRYGYATQLGGISRAMSDTIVVNLAGFSRYSVRSEPTGTVYQSAIVPDGTTITTPNMTQTTFGYWTLDGLQQRDPWGVALRLFSFVVDGAPRDAVAHLFTTDSDADSLPDAFEWYHLGTLAHGATNDMSGDGRTLLQNQQSGQNPLYGYETQLGGISRQQSAQIVVNLQFYPPDNLGMPSGQWFFSNLYTDLQGEFQMPGGFSAPALGDIFGNGTFDLVVGGAGGQAVLWKNAGAPFAADLVEVTNAFAGLPDWPSGPVYPALGDWNADGLADMVVGSDDGLLRFYAAQSSGLPLFVSIGTLSVGSSNQIPTFLPTATGVELLVLDGTTKLVRHYAWTSATPPYAAPATSENFLGMPVTDGLAISAGDTDHDGYVDVIPSDGAGRLWDIRGQADGSFFLQSKVFAGGRDGFHTGLRATLVDFDGDGYLDVIGGGDDGRLVYLRNPSRRLRVNPPLASAARLGEIQFASLDDDGTLVWSIHLNRTGGTINSTNGAYTAGEKAGFDQIIARNASGRIGSAWVNVLGLGGGDSSGWRALLVDGRRSPNDPVWPAAHNLARRAQEILRYRGLQASEIAWLGHGAGASAPPTRAALMGALRDGSTLAVDTETLLVFLVDHGRIGDGGDGLFVLSENETVSGTELNGWLNTLQAARPELAVVFLVESCYGARVAAALGASGDYSARRLVLASSGADELAHMAANGWVSYSMMWWSAVAAGRTMSEAHDSAAEAMSTLQTAWTGLGGGLLADRVVGLDVAGAGRPVISLPAAEITLVSGSTAKIEADVQSPFILERVWGSVIPPNYSPAGDAPVVDLPEIELVRNPSSGKWEASATGFTETGAPYIVILQARDVWGQVSQPVLLRIHNNAVKNRVVIFVPGQETWSGMATALELATYAREVALLRGIAPADIRFYADNAGSLPVDGTATAANLQDAIVNWANTEGQLHTLTLFLVGQGSPQGLVCANGDRITHQFDSLRGWVNTLQAGNAVVVNLIVDADFSGRFVAVGGGPENKRIVVTSTGPDDMNRFSDGEWIGIVRWMWEAVAKGANMRESFAVATEMAALTGPVPAMLDDDGDGLYDRRRDGLQAMNSYVGSAYVTASDPPYIGKASPSRSVDAGGTARFWVSDIIMPDGGDPVSVWGEAVGPDGDSRGSFALWRNLTKNRYDGAFDRFDAAGSYILFIRAGTPGDLGRMTPPVIVHVGYDMPAGSLGLDEDPPQMPNLSLPLTGDYMDVEAAEGTEWRLDLQAGQRVVIEAREVSRRRDVALELRRADGILLRTVNEWGEGFGETIRGWEAPETASYIVRASFLAGQGTAFCRVRAFVLYETPAGTAAQLALQSLDFPQPAARGLADGPLTLQASATSGGAVRFDLREGPATLADTTLSPTNLGVAVVRAYQDGDATWESAVPVSQLVVIAADPEDGYEVWAREQFLSDFDVLGDPTADPNNNGLNNMQSYVAGISPLAPGARLPQFAITPGQLQVEFSAGLRNYLIESRTNLLLGTWQPWTNQYGTGGALQFNLPTQDPNRFYRYRILLQD